MGTISRRTALKAMGGMATSVIGGHDPWRSTRARGHPRLQQLLLLGRPE